jgi:hypothetical protein
MSTTVEFLIRGRDMLSGQFRNMGAAAQSSFNQINAQMARHNQNAAMAGRSINELTARMNQLRASRADLIDVRQLREANREIARIESRINRMQGYGMNRSGSGGGMLGSIVGGNLIAGGVSDLFRNAKDVVMDSLSASMAFGMQERSFQVLTRDAQKGKDLAADLRRLKQSTLVGAGVYGNAQTMLGFGMNSNATVRNLQEVGDVGMGDTQRMQSLALARSQVHAAGRLMGNDLLQFINAGFNPLSVMSERWEEFGFKTQMSIGQLKELVEKGAISSQMVDKAFTVATSKGGQFYKMMDQIGETAGGKMLKMKGSWAAMQIDIGNAMMPMAAGFMDLASHMLHVVDIAKSVPDTLRAEQMQMNTLVHSITELNKGNEVRADMIERLRAKYPELYGNINTEKVYNYELLDVLKQVNREYEHRIRLAEHRATADVTAKEYKEAQDRALKFGAEAQSQKIYGKSAMGLLDWETWSSGYWEELVLGNKESSYRFAAGLAEQERSRLRLLEQQQRQSAEVVDVDARLGLVSQMREVLGSGGKQNKLWGKQAGTNKALLGKEWEQFVALSKNPAAFMAYDVSRIQALLNPTSAAAAGGSTDLGGAAGAAGTRITGGGSRSIVINLGKFQDQIVINAATVKEGVAEMRDMVAEELLRVLQSANAAR